MSDEFENWLAGVCAAEEGCGGVFLPSGSRSRYLTPEQVRRLICRLHRLSGHAPGQLPAGELGAIRARAEWVTAVIAEGTPTRRSPAEQDRAALLAALDAVTADLAAAGGALHDLTSPDQTDGSPAYARGVEDATRRCVAELRAEAFDRHAEADALDDASLRAVADALTNAARALERS